jgi:hypothetical protein
MKRLLGFACVFAVVYPSHATLDFYDSFNYPQTGVQLSTAASPAWVAYTGGGVNPTNILGSLSYPGLQTATGDNSAQFNGLGATGVAARNLSQLYNINNATTLYYSLTFQVTSVSGNDWGGSGNWNSGSFMLGFNQKLQNGSAIAQADAAAPLLIRTGNPSNTGGTADTTATYQLGTSQTATSANRNFDATHTYNVGDTLFLVLSYTFGPNAGDDVAKLWVNPTPGSFEGDNTPVITASGGVDVNSSQVQSFFLRNNSVEPANTVIDDLRIGTTWTEVTPAVPEPGAAALAGFGLFALLASFRLRKR